MEQQVEQPNTNAQDVKAKRREYQRLYYQAHKEKAKEYQRNYNLTHKKKKVGGRKKGEPPAQRPATQETFTVVDISDYDVPVEKLEKRVRQVIRGERGLTK